MDDAHHLRIYLHQHLLEKANARRHRFIGLIDEAVTMQGWEVSYHLDSEDARIQSVEHPGKSLFFMQEPTHDRALNLRLAYFMPFWKIEQTNMRWEWDVAKEVFDPGEVDKDEARKFYRFWAQKLFGDDALNATDGGFVYVPLQGRLLQRRSFQAVSPLDMIRSTLRHEAARPIIVTLHPNETYSDEEIAALTELCESDPRVTLGTGDSGTYLATCSYIVTQNSSVALSGMFFRKPSVLFGRIDFHHISGNVWAQGEADAFFHAQSGRSPFKAYLHWFFRKHAINAGKDDVRDQVLERMRRFGWDI